MQTSRNTIILPDILIAKILNFLHPYLVRFLFSRRQLLKSFPWISTEQFVFPLSLLISLGNTPTLEVFKHVLLSYNLRENLRNIVVEHGSLETIKWFRSNGVSLNKFIVQILAGRGELESFKWSISVGSKFDPSQVLEFSARNNKPKILEWMMINYPLTIVSGDHILYGAILGSCIPMLNWIQTNLPQLILKELEISKISYSRCVRRAVRGNDLKILRWLSDYGFTFQYKEYIDAAGSIDVLKFLRGSNCPWSETFCATVAGKGNLDLLKFATSEGCPWLREDMFRAIAYASPCFDLKLMEWLIEQGCAVGWDNNLVSVATRFGNFEFIKSVKNIGLSAAWNPDIKKKAAARGDLEALKWALHQEKNMDKCLYVLSLNAASGGHLHVLEWLQAENGTSFYLDPQICVVAARAGKVEVLIWAVNNGCVWDRYNCCIAAIKRSKLKVLIWIKQQARHSSPQLWYGNIGDLHLSVCAAQVGNIDIFQWLHLNECPWSTQTYSSAKSKGHTDLLDWAMKNGCPYNAAEDVV